MAKDERASGTLSLTQIVDAPKRPLQDSLCAGSVAIIHVQPAQCDEADGETVCVLVTFQDGNRSLGRSQRLRWSSHSSQHGGQIGQSSPKTFLIRGETCFKNPDYLAHQYRRPGEVARPVLQDRKIVQNGCC